MNSNNGFSLNTNDVNLFIGDITNYISSIFKSQNSSPYSFFNVPLPTYIFIGITTISLAVVSLTENNKENETSMVSSLPAVFNTDKDSQTNEYKEDYKEDESVSDYDNNNDNNYDEKIEPTNNKGGKKMRKTTKATKHKHTKTKKK